MAYTNRGFRGLASGTGTTVTIFEGAPAKAISVVVSEADVLLELNPDSDNEGVPFTIRSGTVLTMTDIFFYGFTIIRGTTATVDVYWW